MLDLKVLLGLTPLELRLPWEDPLAQVGNMEAIWVNRRSKVEAWGMQHWREQRASSER